MTFSYNLCLLARARKLPYESADSQRGWATNGCERLLAGSLELEVVLAGDRFREPVTMDRDGTGGRCQMSWERWADIADDSAIEKTAQMIVAVTVSCAASR